MLRNAKNWGVLNSIAGSGLGRPKHPSNLSSQGPGESVHSLAGQVHGVGEQLGALELARIRRSRLKQNIFDQFPLFGSKAGRVVSNVMLPINLQTRDAMLRSPVIINPTARVNLRYARLGDARLGGRQKSKKVAFINI